MIATTRAGFHRFTIGLLLALSLSLAGGLLSVVQAQAAGRAAAPAAQAAQVARPGPAYAAGEVLVRLRAGASLSGKKALASALGAAGFRDLRVQAILPPGQRILLFKSTTLTGDALVKSALRNPNVIAASLNYRRYADAVTPNDPRFPELWGLNNTGQSGGTPGADISAPEAWSTTTGSAAVVVASIDTGVAYDHPDLAANMWRNPGEIPANGIDDDGNGYIDDVYGMAAYSGSGDPYDIDGHGTHTSGTMAAVGNNGVGVTGVAWQARVMALQSFAPDGYIWDDDAITSLDYVVHEKLDYGVNVVAINASWGGAGYDSLLRSAINAAGAAGIVFCTSAGNGGDDDIGDNNDVTPQYPSSYDCSNIISVAASGSTDTLASWSNYGPTSVDLAAPGVSILSTVPGGGYESWGATSMATPHVTGALALCAARYPSETMTQRVRRILDHVDAKASLSGKMTTGGRLNAAAAVGTAVAAPTVTSFTPTSGPVGTVVTVTGSGFTGAAAVAFNGAAASFSVASDAQITATVPSGATSGAIAVTTPNGAGVSAASFAVTGTGMSINITAPTGTSSYAVGADLTVSWTTSSAASSGEFGLWARSPGGGWYAAKLVPAGGGTNFTTLLTLDVPPGGGYEAIVAWRATAGGAWSSWGTSPGSFTVTGTGLSINVTAPTGSASYPTGASLTVSWTTSSAATSGEFGLWARSPGGGWYAAKLVPASGGASFSTPLTLDAPPGGGYEAIVAWRATAGGAWSSWGTSPGSFTVTGTGLSINVTAPTGNASYPAGADLTVSWTTSSAVSSGELGVWARSPGGGWYIGKIVAVSGLASYTTSVTLDVPAGGGYQAIVAWRAAAGSGAWTVFGTSPGSFAVTGTGLAIGDPYQGGIIAYIDGSGLHGLIAATADQSTGWGMSWYNGSYTVTGATATALGTGMANTTTIIASQGGIAISYAAGRARAYKGGGYTDWYLPSLDELNELYINQDAIGGFESQYYWSSSEVDTYSAWDQSFFTGYQYDSDKFDWDGVRAVRSF